MKSDTRYKNGRLGRLDTSKAMTPSLSSSSVTTREKSISPRMRSKAHTDALPKLKREMERQYLSKSLEKPFLRMKANPKARDAYVQAEVVTSLAHQIRAIRMQRGWTQADLAKRLKTTQAAISRLEDPGYGRLTMKSLIELSRIFDTGLQVNFIPFVTMLKETYFPQARSRNVPSFEEEANSVDFFWPVETKHIESTSIVATIQVPLRNEYSALITHPNTGNASMTLKSAHWR